MCGKYCIRLHVKIHGMDPNVQWARVSATENESNFLPFIYGGSEICSQRHFPFNLDLKNMLSPPKTPYQTYRQGFCQEIKVFLYELEEFILVHVFI